MPNKFLETVEPHILSDDKFVRNFALRVLNTAHLGSEQTFFLAFQALDKLPHHPLVNTILPYTKQIPLTENVLKEVLKRLQKKDDNFLWYSMMIAQCDTDLIAEYQSELAAYVNKDAVDEISSLLSMDTEALFIEAGRIMNALEQEFSQSLFSFGERVFKELVKRGEYDEAKFWEIEAVIKEESNKDYFSFNGIYNIFLAGEQKVTSLVPLLTALYERVEENFLMQELTKTLIKIGTPEVILAVEKYVLKEETSHYAIAVLGNVKHLAAEEVLLRKFELTADKSMQTVLADALCSQLSSKAIPKVVALIEEGYDEMIVDLKEPLYANCVINEIDHPKLASWKKDLIGKDEYRETQRIESIKLQAERSKIGRNEPCPCGSGKKFKKCCGK